MLKLAAAHNKLILLLRGEGIPPESLAEKARDRLLEIAVEVTGDPAVRLKAVPVEFQQQVLDTVETNCIGV